MITVQVKHGSATVAVELSSDLKVLDLQQRLEEQLGVFVRKQKIIHKGKVLVGSSCLKDNGIGNNAKLLLLVADAAQTQTKVSLT